MSHVWSVDAMSKCVVGYVRLSSRDAKDGDVSLVRQREVLERWCVENNYELKNVYSDVKISGKRKHRPGLDQAIREASLRRCTLVVTHLDRLMRDSSVLERLKTEKIAFRALDCPEANEMMLGVMAVMAAYYSRAISAKMRDYHRSREALAVKGEIDPHYIPKNTPAKVYSENLQRGNETASENAATKRKYAWSAISPLLAQGLSNRAIAVRLNDDGIRPSRGDRWSGVTVGRIVKEFSDPS